MGGRPYFRKKCQAFKNEAFPACFLSANFKIISCFFPRACGYLTVVVAECGNCRFWCMYYEYVGSSVPQIWIVNKRLADSHTKDGGLIIRIYSYVHMHSYRTKATFFSSNRITLSINSNLNANHSEWTYQEVAPRNDNFQMHSPQFPE